MNIGGDEFRVDSAGQGEPLLCISGLGYSSWCWSELRDEFSATHRVITFDNRGTGRSVKSPEPYSIALLADDAAAVLDALGIAQAHVLGHSMGGYIAQTLALRHSQKIRSLILVGTSAGGLGALPLPQATQHAWQQAAGLPPAESARINMPISFAPGWTYEHPRQFESFLQRRVQYPTPPECWLAQYKACADYFVQGVEAEHITPPALVIHGSADRVVPFANGERLAQRLPEARWIPFEGVGHIPYLEDPARFARELRAHLLRHAAQAALKA